jgi:protein gp37
MADTTKISWADATHNHWIGCQKVSPACDSCYAENLMDTRMGRVQWGAPGKGAGTRSLTSLANREKPLAWQKKAKAEGTRPFVFCSSLSDVFDNQVPNEWRMDLFSVIRRTPNLVWLLLTKRPQLIVSLSEDAGGLPPNVALGTTIEDQERANRNVPALLDAACTVVINPPLFTFVSCEPLLGPIDLAAAHRRAGGKISWCISGGETDQGANKARPSNPKWFRSLRDQCAAAGVPFHHKQNGEFAPAKETSDPGEIFTFPDGTAVRRVGKTLAGRTLDGVTHDARPEIA